jgi:hypothetical protein
MNALPTNESLMVYFNFLSILSKTNLSTSSASKHKPNKIPKKLGQIFASSSTPSKILNPF